MTVLTAAMPASTYAEVLPASSTALNALNLANQPPSGGMPASEAKKIVIATARPGAYPNSPPNEEISPLLVLRDTAITIANAPRFMNAYTSRYTITAFIAEPGRSEVPANASGIRMNPPWLIEE